jgi:hypothetical protein
MIGNSCNVIAVALVGGRSCCFSDSMAPEGYLILILGSDILGVVGASEGGRCSCSHRATLEGCCICILGCNILVVLGVGTDIGILGSRCRNQKTASEATMRFLRLLFGERRRPYFVDNVFLFFFRLGRRELGRQQQRSTVIVCRRRP